MTQKKNTRVCRYWNCPHNRNISIDTDPYHVDGKAYYHPDCWEKREKERQKDDATKASVKYIREQWQQHISRTVSMSDLNNCLNELLARGYASDYLVFTFDYIVQHNLNLHWPRGFRYFVEKDYIKAAYAKHATSVSRKIDDIEEPQFNVKPVSVGFQNILGGGK